MLAGLCTCLVAGAFAQSYPYALPKTVTATINVNTRSKKWCGPQMFGMNQKSLDTAFNDAIQPVGLRGIARGVWANFYDYRIDACRRYDTYDNKDHTAPLATWTSNGTKIGIDEINAIRKKHNSDMLLTFGLNYDQCHNNWHINKFIDKLKQKGFPVTAIELGNEWFFTAQRSNRLNTFSKIQSLAKSAAYSIHKKVPGAKISIPLSWRSGHESYNQTLVKDNYFDAVTVHAYFDESKASSRVTSTNYKDALRAGKILTDRIAVIRQYSTKPIWLSEFAAQVGKNRQAAGALAAADLYLTILNDLNTFQRACWYGSASALDPIYTISGSTYEKTVMGASYQIIKDAFNGSSVYGSWMTTHQLESGVPAVNAKACYKSGKMNLVAVNKTNKYVKFTVKINGKNSTKTYSHRSMKFNSLNGTRTFSVTQDPTKWHKPAKTSVMLPPYSVNTLREK